MDLEAFELVLLRRPENPPDYDDAELERIQREHLAHHARLRVSGQVVTNGPVIEPPDPSLRGLTFYRTGSLEEARRLAEADPAVRAGRLTADAGVRVAVGDQRRAHLPVIRLEDRIEFGAVARPEYLQREAGVGRIVVRAADQGERPDADPLALGPAQRAVSIP